MLSHVQPLQPHGPKPTRLLCPWNFPGKNTTKEGKKGRHKGRHKGSRGPGVKFKPFKFQVHYSLKPNKYRDIYDSVNREQRAKQTEYRFP